MNVCPSSEVLQRYFRNDLPPDETRRVVDHVDSCSACQGTLNQLSQFPDDMEGISGSTLIKPDPVPGDLPLRTISGTGRSSQPGSVERHAKIINGRYQLLRSIGSGSFGEVFRAHDPELDRPVAIKLLRTATPATADQQQKFVREAQRAAQLRHPGLVAVHDIGKEDDQIFIVTDLIDGKDLAHRIRNQKLTCAEAVDLVAQVADALHYAHLQNLIHRDIKPSNILLDADGRAYVADFGLAVWYDELARESPGWIGTLAYMSPEQARGESHRIDNRTDIYSLGITLYELLCGHTPFVCSGRRELVDSILSQEPRAPRSVDDRIPRKLEHVCLKAISKRMTDRYTTAGDMAEELREAVTRSASQRELDLISLDRLSRRDISETHQRSTETDGQAMHIIPKGLRPYGAEDADFFLQLLPGPRDRNGIPDSLRFWKQRIESRDPDMTFEVGLISGPSGCGKSSFLRAGLLPQLADTILPVYVEATRDETATHLKQRLLQRFPHLDPKASPRELISRLRTDQNPGREAKVLIVIDQLEQWLNASGPEPDSSGLVDALRQADGERIQCLLLVRDDFSLATYRLFRSLEIEMDTHRNVRLLDLLDRRHALRVLEWSGKAHGQLPMTGPPDSDQKTFLNRVVDQLSTEQLVIPVQLSLFVHMMRNRRWTDESLAEVGGTEGIGVRFFEETFTSRSAEPHHRALAATSRTLLAALLPERGLKIKGQRQSAAELAACCGLACDSQQFIDVVEILDRKLHVITPIEADELSCAEPKRAEPESVGAAEAQYYQLTHDYLVIPLRQWLTDQARRNWRGRTALRLEELTTQWSRSRDRRYLPSLFEHVQIRLAVPGGRRTESQRDFLRSASKAHGLFVVATLIIVCVFVWRAAAFRDVVRAETFVDNLKSAEPSQLKSLLNDQLPSVINSIDFNAEWKRTNDPNERLRLSLAMPDRTEFLHERLFDAESKWLLPICTALNRRGEAICQQLWPILLDESLDPDRRLRAAVFLAQYQPEDRRWNTVSSQIAALLIAVNDNAERDSFLVALSSIHNELVDPLMRIARTAKEERTRIRSTVALSTHFSSTFPGKLAEDLLTYLDSYQFEQIYESVKSQKARITPGLLRTTEIELPPARWQARIDPLWPTPHAGLKSEFEQSMGTLSGTCAFCQTMTWPQFMEICEALRDYHYRPVRIRPYADRETTRVAAIWTRDTYAWELLCDSEENQLNRLPVMRKGSEQPLGLLDIVQVGPHQTCSLFSAGIENQPFYLGDDALGPLTTSRMMSQCYSEEKNASELPAGYSFTVGMSADVRRQLYPGSLQVDVQHRQDGAICAAWLDRHQAAAFESVECFGPDLLTHLNACRQRLEQGYHPFSISVHSSGDALQAASVWIRPRQSATERQLTTKRRGRAAYVLMRLEQPESAWNVFADTENNGVRSQLLHCIRNMGCDFRVLLDRMELESNRGASGTNSLAAILIALEQVVPDKERSAVTPLIYEIYQRHEHSGVHAAAEWLLRTWKMSHLIREFELTAARANERKTIEDQSVWWNVNSEQHTMIMLQPKPFLLGSPADEPSRSQGLDELSQWAICKHPFAIASKEVTREQFERFAKEQPEYGISVDFKYAPSTDCPQTKVTWNHAAAYCNWLSTKEGLPECYEETAEGFRAKPDYLELTGYRLPTELEWEFACRAGTADSRYFGDDENLLADYAWYVRNSDSVSHPVGTKIPNDNGLFDMYGNVLEWCHYQRQMDSVENEDRPWMLPMQNSEVSSSSSRIARGGAYSAQPRHVRSAMRYKYSTVTDRGASNRGFRIVRTLRSN